MMMDTSFATLKSTAHLATVTKGGGLTNGEDGIFGERIRGSLNGNVWVNQLAKSLKLDEKRKHKFKPGVASSVITTENGKETLVSSFYSIIIWKSSFVNPLLLKNN